MADAQDLVSPDTACMAERDEAGDRQGALIDLERLAARDQIKRITQAQVKTQGNTRRQDQSNRPERQYFDRFRIELALG